MKNFLFLSMTLSCSIVFGTENMVVNDTKNCESATSVVPAYHPDFEKLMREQELIIKKRLDEVEKRLKELKSNRS
ncbi:hypothetical protein OAB57_03675 [Bacteriovoracaceae bacterium]|nr:hypothetical protein [Bacteriovoracaceae bacterium]